MNTRLLTFVFLPLPVLSLRAGEQPKPIPFDQLGTEVQKQYKGDGISITPTTGGRDGGPSCISYHWSDFTHRNEMGSERLSDAHAINLERLSSGAFARFQCSAVVSEICKICA